MSVRSAGRWSAASLALALLAACPGTPEPNAACQTNNDCGDGFVCGPAGTCLPVAGGEGEGEGENPGEGEGENPAEGEGEGEGPGEGEGENPGEGEGEGENPAEGEGEGEGEGEDPIPVRQLRIEVGPGRARSTAGRFTLTGGVVGHNAPITVRGARFTLRPLTGERP